MKITALTIDHYPAVDAIYLEGIATGHATFQTEGKTWEEWNAGHLPSCRLVALDGNTVFGWAALSPVSSRGIYTGVAEANVYIASTARGKGVGTALLQRLVLGSEIAGIWALQAGIFLRTKPALSCISKRVLGSSDGAGGSAACIPGNGGTLSY